MIPFLSRSDHSDKKPPKDDLCIATSQTVGLWQRHLLTVVIMEMTLTNNKAQMESKEVGEIMNIYIVITPKIKSRFCRFKHTP